jgi:hypothetical protein
MESEKTGAELLLSEPEIVAWLGLYAKRGNVPVLHPTQSPVRPAAPTPRALRVGLLL